MDTALETRIRAAGAELTKPGRWRLALAQLDQATAQLLASPDIDRQSAQLALEQLHSLYSWASVMQRHELRMLNSDVFQLSAALATE